MKSERLISDLHQIRKKRLRAERLEAQAKERRERWQLRYQDYRRRGSEAPGFLRRFAVVCQNLASANEQCHTMNAQVASLHKEERRRKILVSLHTKVPANDNRTDSI